MKGKCVLLRAFWTMLLAKRWDFLSLCTCVCAASLSLVLVFVELCGRSHQLTEELKLTPQTKINYLKWDEMVRMCHLSEFVGALAM